jgi:hypothetical protein
MFTQHFAKRSSLQQEVQKALQEHAEERPQKLFEGCHSGKFLHVSTHSYGAKQNNDDY